jgi:hypothetical protein
MAGVMFGKGLKRELLLPELAIKGDVAPKQFADWLVLFF